MARRRGNNPYATTLDGPLAGQGAYDMPYQNPGIVEGEPGSGPGPGQPQPERIPPTQPPAGPGYKPRLEGFEAGKLGDAAQAQKSPKYALGQLLNSGQYGYQDGAAILKRLQDDYDYFDNWTLQGDKFRYTGDGELHGAFEGVDEIDFLRNATQGGEFDPEQAAFWFGASSPQSRALEQAKTSGGAGGSWLQAPAGGGAGMPPGGGGGGAPGGGFGDLKSVLAGIYGNEGNFNQGIVNRRVDSARGALEGQRKSRLATNEAALASRGLIGDGVQHTSMGNLEEDLYGEFSDSVSNIFADESENANSRMMQALSLATGMSLEEASQAIRMFQAQTDRDLGWGNIGLGYHKAGNDFALGQGGLALGNLNAMNSYNLGMGQLGLGYDQLANQIENGDFDKYIQLLDMWLRGSGISSDGFVGS
jgi:hypothetical protein